MRTNYEKRAEEHIAVIREIANMLPIGKRNQVLNRCGRLSMLYRKQETDTRTNKQMEDSIVGHYNTTKNIVAALLSGRTLSYMDMKEFRTVEWHTRICEAKEIIKDRYPEYVFCSKWVSEGGHPYKQYWLEIMGQEDEK